MVFLLERQKRHTLEEEDQWPVRHQAIVVAFPNLGVAIARFANRGSHTWPRLPLTVSSSSTCAPSISVRAVNLIYLEPDFYEAAPNQNRLRFGAGPWLHRLLSSLAMRIMTANLFNVNVSVDSFAEVLDEHRPDIVAIQELSQPSAAVLADRYDYGMAFPDGVQGCALVANHPITVTRTDLPFRPLLSAPVEVGDRTVMFGAVHLANPVGLHDIGFRRHQVRALIEEIQGTAPMVLVGDYNSSPAWPAYRMITRHLRDGVSDWAKRAGTRPSRTWNWGAGSPKLLRIDHIMVRGVEVADVKVIDIAGSDHRAVVADIA